MQCHRHGKMTKGADVVEEIIVRGAASAKYQVQQANRKECI